MRGGGEAGGEGGGGPDWLQGEQVQPRHGRRLQQGRVLRDGAEGRRLEEQAGSLGTLEALEAEPLGTLEALETRALGPLKARPLGPLKAEPLLLRPAPGQGAGQLLQPQAVLPLEG